ncbi:MAG TPA: response regulator [Thermoanaerobaculia bacterium]|nr:response regulator [Thermoanaerobaculia bacterium]
MSGKVLIVDDEPDLIAGIVELLREEGIEVETHDSIITLPLVVRQVNPDLVLIDLSMPALPGCAVFKLGRERLGTDAPLVLFSGRAAHELAKRAEELGADGFLAKSQEPLDIIARIQSWIDHRRAVLAAGRVEDADASRTASAVAH